MAQRWCELPTKTCPPEQNEADSLAILAAVAESDIGPTAIVLDFPWKGGSIPLLKLREAITMGDKSPKAKDKSRKQDIADRNQKLLAAKAKLSPSPVFPGKKPR